jgi:hypothetical protein
MTKSHSGMLSDLELDHLLALVKDRGNIMEIGVHVGYTTKALAEANPDKIIYAVDFAKCSRTPTNPDQGMVVTDWTEVCYRARDLENVVYINCNTQSKGFFIPISVGVVFIDGDHTYIGVKNDYFKAVSPNRRIIFHDYVTYPPDSPRSWVGVKKFVDELRRQNTPITIIHNTMLAYLDIP